MQSATVTWAMFLLVKVLILQLIKDIVLTEQFLNSYLLNPLILKKNRKSLFPPENNFHRIDKKTFFISVSGSFAAKFSWK